MRPGRWRNGPRVSPAAVPPSHAEAPRWNFHKYPIGRSGTRVQSFSTRIAPDRAQLVGAIERLLAEP